jgi:hypothetical protein
MHGFIQRLRSTELGLTTEQEWHEWTSTCGCVWTPGAGTESERFPTSRDHERILDSCELHKVIEAGGDYLDLIDRDWTRLADWYHLDAS